MVNQQVVNWPEAMANAAEGIMYGNDAEIAAAPAACDRNRLRLYVRCSSIRHSASCCLPPAAGSAATVILPISTHPANPFICLMDFLHHTLKSGILLECNCFASSLTLYEGVP